MLDVKTETEYKARINSVIDFILKNLNGDLSLQTLSNVANYSPFHLQKVFKQITGETPKQYIIKLRLESAFHLIVVHPHKSILEISLDCGFSSASVFSRAMKNYFNISPDKIRSLTPREHVKYLKDLNLKPTFNKTLSSKKNHDKVVVRIKKTESLWGIYLLAPFNDTAKIQQAFKELMKIAEVNDLDISDSKLYGILSPQQGHTYKAFLSLNRQIKTTAKLNTTELKGGKYVAIIASGEVQETVKAVHYIFHKWLPESGYKIADPVIGFETFSQSPDSLTYIKIEREIHIPIQPK